MSTRHPSRPTTSASTARPPTAPPRPPLKVDPTAHVADKASITGTFPISIAASAVVHPYARLTSTSGPIEIGEGAVVWERAIVGEGAAGESGDAERKTTLGRYVVIEAGASIGAGAHIGERSVVEVGAKVGVGCAISEVSSAVSSYLYNFYEYEHLLFQDIHHRVCVTFA